MAREKIKFALRIAPETQQLVKELCERDNCQSQNEFIEKAIRFYVGYLSGNEAGEYLPQALVDAFRATLRDSENHISRLLFKLAVEVDILMHVLASAVEIDPAILHKPTADFKPKAPGMKYTHYSPKAEVFLVKGEQKAVAERINALAAAERAAGKKVGVMATEETKTLYHADIILSLGSRAKPEEIGANLFKTLRKFDFLGVDVVYSEVFSEKGEGMAIMNRLNKAAGYRVLEAE